MATTPDPGTVPTTCVLVASSAAEVLTLAAAVRSGALDPAARRLLVLERSGRAAGTRGLAERLGLVDDVVAAGTFLAAPPDLAGVVELVVGTRTLDLGRSVARHLETVPVTLVAAGAEAYGPTPEPVRGRLARLTTRVLHLDLVPGLAPLLLAERHVPATAVPVEDRRAVVEALETVGPLADPTTLVVGRHQDWSGALDPDVQPDLLAAMVTRCAEAGLSRIVLLLDPGTRPRTHRLLEKAARQARADLTLVEDDGPVDRWAASPGVRLVVGCAAEDLLVAAAVHGRRTAQLDTAVVLKRLEPYADPRRTAATLVAATVPDLRSWTAAPEGQAPPAVDLAGLLATVAYTMRPELAPGRRREAIAFLGSVDDVRTFVRRRRLSALRLPGGKRRVRASLG